MTHKAIRVGIIGLGGFAACHHDAVRELEAEGAGRLICACDPAPVNFKERMAELDFAGRKVRIFDDYRRMLEECRAELDMVVVPTPVPLHAEMHRACVEAGPAVYLEKPPTLNYAELEEMLAIEAKARRATLVGFNFIVEQTRRELKRRLLAGEFGAVKQVTFCGLWPRATSYFQRAGWAGRLTMNSKLALDFAMGNALAHYVHNILFWAGREKLFSWAGAQAVEAQLYRAHRIEGPDTVFVKARLEGDVVLRGVFTHACATEPSLTCEQVICERGAIAWTPETGFRVEPGDGAVTTLAAEPRLLQKNHREYYRYLRGEVERPLTRLADCIPFVQLCDLTYIAAGEIHAVPAEYIERRILPDNSGESVAIAGIAGAAERFIREGVWPAAPAVPWAQPGGQATRKDLASLPKVIARMAASIAMI